MTALLKRLAAVDERVAKATPGWEFDNVHSGAPGDEPHGVLKIGGKVVAYLDDSLRDDDAELIEHAPLDLPYLSRLLRMVAEAPCESYIPPTSCLTADSVAAAHACLPCRVRREGERP